MNKTTRIRQWVGATVLTVALVLLGVSILSNQSHVDTESAARDLGEAVTRRLDRLDGFIAEAFAQDPDAWMQLRDLPEDMVVYRYREDTLQSWAHQFPIRNDDIRQKMLLQRLGDSRGAFLSPLLQIGQDPTYVNYGPKWFLAKSVTEGETTVIAGLEIANELDAVPLGGINPRFHLNDRYSILPITGSTGVPVHVYGIPLFKITSERMSEPDRHSSLLFWLGVIAFLAGTLLLLGSWPRPVSFAVISILQFGFLACLYFYGRRLGNVSQLFSPLLYADGPWLYSLGAVVLFNLLITVWAMDLYLMRWTLFRWVRSCRSALPRIGAAAGPVLLLVLVGIYIHFAFSSIVFNSGICLELYKVNLLDVYTGIVYLSFLVLSLVIPLMVQLLSYILRAVSGLRFSAFSRTGRLAYAVLTAGYFVLASSLLGFRKEQNRVQVWANRLAMDRDISLELQLRSVEGSIASDAVIGSLTLLENSQDLIRGRLANTYLTRLSQDYDISVAVVDPSADMDILFNERIRSGIRLADNSHFFYSSGTNGRARYTGLFSYYNPEFGATQLLLLVESKSNREDRGYLSLLGVSEPGRVTVPPQYSYAKYVSDRLVMYKGDYAYPTRLSPKLKQLSAEGRQGNVKVDGYTHFVLGISDDEEIVISREVNETLSYVVEGALFGILAYLLLSLVVFRLHRRKSGERHYYRTRINVVLYVSLTLTLVAMAVFSVYFVNRRNNADLQNSMTTRINTLQTMLQNSFRMIPAPSDLLSQPARSAVESIGNDLKCDISLFSPQGLLLLSTTPEIYDRMIMGLRIDEEAFYNIVHQHRRFCIHREKSGSRRYYALYAPIFNAEGNMVAIVSSPYTDQSYDFEAEAMVHIASIITVFLLLLMIARVVTEEVIGRMFRPLSEMSRKMKVSDVDHLEYIIYDQEDEVSTLVRAYNLMVHDLSDSARQLAQAERDKAWSAMARQVAHEIKNPLTPIKLKLQMLIRMKQSGNPAWEEKFDEVSAAVLEHIDILADTANEFSTFAKLYTEEPVDIDLDSLVQEEVAMFDARDDISFEYYGLEGAVISGPKPQLTRVLVNLITNSVQALEADGRTDGRIVVSVRNSSKEGFYDIVVEDNGPGVREENRSRLFTPDFTTKSHGSGLGLAICRNIIDRCKGEIFYSKSFTLGGACFTIRYPKSK